LRRHQRQDAAVGRRHAEREPPFTHVETLNGASVIKIVTGCPQCFNTQANEYPDFGGR
jgi:hypothetical protein